MNSCYKRILYFPLFFLFFIGCAFNIHADDSISGFDYTNYFSVDWIASDGLAYIDSGVLPDRNTIVEASVSGYTTGTIFGVNSSGSSTGFYRLYVDSSSYKARIVTSNIVTFGSVVSSQIAISINPRGDSQVGSYTYGTSRSNSSPATRNMYIMAYNSQGSVSSFTDAHLYFLFIKDYNSGSYTHKFYPAVRKSDQKVGLYDVVSSSFYTSSSGSFTYGGSVTTTYTITTSVSPSGSGVVTGGGEYDSGSTATLTATANSGYVFNSWSDGSTANPRSVLVDSSKSFTALFDLVDTPTTTYTITTSVSPSGSGVVTGGGEYDSGSTATLTATANNGYVFSSWSDGSTANPRSVLVDSNKSFTANFVADSTPTESYTITTSVSPSGSGVVTGGGEYYSGSTATLTATANSGYVFNSWSDGSTANPRTFSVTSDLSLTAYFTQDYSNNILVGSYVSIVGGVGNEFYAFPYTINDYGTNQDVGYRYYASPVDNSGTIDYSSYRYFFNLHGVLNDDYIGSIVVNLYKRDSASSSTSTRFLTRTIYVNGNCFDLGFGNTELTYNILDSTISASFNFSGLTKKLNTNSLISDGTADSGESADALTEENEDLSSSVSQVSNIESSYNDDLNSALEDININDMSPSGFGSNFLTSAAWVSNQFNRLTSNTPFGSILGFSLVLGLSLLIIGKVIK